jgi:3-hydroxyisobutyrate dehydrogenase-like beta-hydroxyacid dehydrogenase
MAHDPEAARVIEEAVGAEVVRAGEFRMRVLAAADEQVALSILDALDRHGLEIVRKGASKEGDHAKPGPAPGV